MPEGIAELINHSFADEGVQIIEPPLFEITNELAELTTSVLVGKIVIGFTEALLLISLMKKDFGIEFKPFLTMLGNTIVNAPCEVSTLITSSLQSIKFIEPNPEIYLVFNVVVSFMVLFFIFLLTHICNVFF